MNDVTTFSLSQVLTKWNWNVREDAGWR